MIIHIGDNIHVILSPSSSISSAPLTILEVLLFLLQSHYPLSFPFWSLPILFFPNLLLIPKFSDARLSCNPFLFWPLDSKAYRKQRGPIYLMISSAGGSPFDYTNDYQFYPKSQGFSFVFFLNLYPFLFNLLHLLFICLTSCCDEGAGQ